MPAKEKADYSRLEPGRASSCLCPICDKGKNDKALKVTVEPHGFVWFCHRCQSTGASRTRPYDCAGAPATPNPHQGST